MISPGPDSNSWLELTGRLTLAIGVGGIIGWNRHTVTKTAGLATYMLVSLSAALFVLIPLESDLSSSSSAVSRVIQGIATGIGFLGAGMIVQQPHSETERPPIGGLTSAAAIWVTAALGILAVCGFWLIALIGTLMVILILQGGLWLERIIRRHRER